MRRPGEDPRERPYHVNRPEDSERSFESDTGSFDLQDLSKGEWVLTARGAGDSRSIPKAVQVPQAGNEPTLVLPREGTITGAVLGLTDEKIPGASIYVVYGHQDTPHQDLGPKPRSRSDAKGEFRVHGVQPGTLHVVASHPEHCDSELTEVAVAPGGIANIQLRLSQGGRITGNVDPSQGQVSVRQIDLFSFNLTVGWRSTKSDKAGKFTIDNVIPQAYVIELRPEGYPEVHAGKEGQGVRKRITVRNGETTNVVLGEDRGAINVTGIVMCQGKPVAGIEVSAEPKEGGEDRQRSVTTGPDGRFELVVNGAGEYVFRVRAGWSYAHLDRMVENRNGKTEVNLEVPGGAISGVVFSANGKPVAHAPVTLTQISKKEAVDREAFWKFYHRGKTGDDGTFEFKMLEPGLYTLRTPDGFQSDSPPPRTLHGRVVMKFLRVGRSPAKPLEIRLPSEGRISGRVVDAAGNPVRDAFVVALDSGKVPQSGDWETSTDVTGSFNVFSLAPGTYTVDVRAATGQGRSQPVKVDADKTSEVVIELR